MSIEEIVAELETIHADVIKNANLFAEGNQAAGTRARTAVVKYKKEGQNLRVTIQEIKNAAK